MRDRWGRFEPGYVRDPLDPRGWEHALPYRPIYLACGAVAIVDDTDWLWAIENLWRATPDKTGRKLYASRSIAIGDGRKSSLYLHKEILIRSGAVPPSPRHTIGDHRNGNSLDNRRINLRWATPSQNRLNVHGLAWRQRELSYDDPS